jgi:hypothetical protein
MFGQHRERIVADDREVVDIKTRLATRCDELRVDRPLDVLLGDLPHRSDHVEGKAEPERERQHAVQEPASPVACQGHRGDHRPDGQLGNRDCDEANPIAVRAILSAVNRQCSMSITSRLGSWRAKTR